MTSCRKAFSRRRYNVIPCKCSLCALQELGNKKRLDAHAQYACLLLVHSQKHCYLSMTVVTKLGCKSMTRSGFDTS